MVPVYTCMSWCERIDRRVVLPARVGRISTNIIIDFNAGEARCAGTAQAKKKKPKRKDQNGRRKENRTRIS